MIVAAYTAILRPVTCNCFIAIYSGVAIAYWPILPNTTAVTNFRTTQTDHTGTMVGSQVDDSRCRSVEAMLHFCLSNIGGRYCLCATWLTRCNVAAVLHRNILWQYCNTAATMLQPTHDVTVAAMLWHCCCNVVAMLYTVTSNVAYNVISNVSASSHTQGFALLHWHCWETLLKCNSVDTLQRCCSVAQKCLLALLWHCLNYVTILTWCHCSSNVAAMLLQCCCNVAHCDKQCCIQCD